MARVCVLGAGSWGTALGNHLRRGGHDIVMWSPEIDVLADISHNNQNSKYFPGEGLTAGIKTEQDCDLALQGAEVVVVSVPSSVYREVAKKLKNIVGSGAIIVSTGKGLEEGTLSCLTAVLSEELNGYDRIVALSGPSFAAEVLRGLPTAVVMAAKNIEIAKEAAAFFHFDYFRVYSSTDLIGVELGGAIKNIIALAVGMVDGAKMGNNARAALITRGLAEMQRLIVAMGGQAMTIVGLSGLGDLLLTSTGDLSRNRRAGLALGQGKHIQDVLKEIGQVVEGVATAPKAKLLAEKKNISMPIVTEVNRVLTGETTVKEAIKVLLSRAPNSEFRSS